MAGSQPHWGAQHFHSLSFGPENNMEHNMTELRHQAPEAPRPTFPFGPSPLCSDAYCLTRDPHTLRPHEGDQVVPSFQRLTVIEGQRRPKPLPPPPDPEELMLDEAADGEVEFFTSDRRSLLPRSCTKALCYGAPSRGKGSGQVNNAFQDGPSVGVCEDPGCVAPSWPGESGTHTGPNLSADSWAIGGVKYGASGQRLQREDHEQMVIEVRNTSRSKQSQRPLSSTFRYLGQSSTTPFPSDKPEIPPRIPIRPKTSTLPKPTKGNCSLSNEDEDKPPKIPPRVPLVPSCPPRTPSPKSLPLYINGVMPATQSFAPNPKYVRRVPQRRQSERAPPTDQRSPCIVPVVQDGQQASATHYFLLPRHPAYTHRLQRFLSEPERKEKTDWSGQNR